MLSAFRERTVSETKRSGQDKGQDLKCGQGCLNFALKFMTLCCVRVGGRLSIQNTKK